MKKILILLLVTTGYCFGANVEKIDPRHENLSKPERELFEAISTNDLKEVKSILENNPNINLNVEDQTSMTPLFYAADAVHSPVGVEIINLLLKHGADINKENKNFKKSFWDYVDLSPEGSKDFYKYLDENPKLNQEFDPYLKARRKQIKEQIHKDTPISADVSGTVAEYIQ